MIFGGTPAGALNCAVEIKNQAANTIPEMSGCCDNNCSIDALHQRQRGTLHIVLAINAVMFVVILGAALYGNSTALLADSLDNFGDALTYGLSLYAVSWGAGAKARVALFKGVLIFLATAAVAGHVIYKLLVPGVPIFEIMGVFSLLGLAARMGPRMGKRCSDWQDGAEHAR